MKMKKIIFLFSAIHLLISCSFFHRNKASLPSESHKVTSQNQKTIAATEITLEQTKSGTTSQKSTSNETINTLVPEDLPRISATVKPLNKTNLGIQSNGQIIKILVRPGDFVQKNQVLVQVDNTQLKLELEKSQLDLHAKETQWHTEQKKYSNQLEQLKSGIISQKSIDNEKNNLENVKIEYESAQIQLHSKKKYFENSYLKAPYSGTISQTFKSLGDYVTEGTPVLEMIQNNHLFIYAQVPISFYSLFQKQKEFQYVNPLTQQKGQIQVEKIVPMIDSSSRTFDIYAKFKDDIQKQLPGDYIEILLNEK